MNIKSPMLAGVAPEFEKIQFPVMATPKFDGIRCLTLPPTQKGKLCSAVSRSFKPIPNTFVREYIEAHCPPGLDGELVLARGEFSDVTSAISRASGIPNFKYCVFDFFGEGVRHTTDASERFERLSVVLKRDLSHIEIVVPTVITTPENLAAFERKMLARGFEGVMVRDPSSPYKCGRSTSREGYLLKIKRFADAEAVVIGFAERMHNANEAHTDAFGHVKRSNHKANKYGMDCLGSLLCRTPEGVEFSLSGFDGKTSLRLWKSRKKLIGKIAKYKFQPSGTKVAPRFPVFLGFRGEFDL